MSQAQLLWVTRFQASFGPTRMQARTKQFASVRTLVLEKYRAVGADGDKFCEGRHG